MKVRLTVDLDIPGVEGYSKAELEQLIFDAYTNYTTCAHLRDALEYCSNKEPIVRKLQNYHETWSDICSGATTSVEIL